MAYQFDDLAAVDAALAEMFADATYIDPSPIDLTQPADANDDADYDDSGEPDTVVASFVEKLHPRGLDGKFIDVTLHVGDDWTRITDNKTGGSTYFKHEHQGDLRGYLNGTLPADRVVMHPDFVQIKGADGSTEIWVQKDQVKILKALNRDGRFDEGPSGEAPVEPITSVNPSASGVFQDYAESMKYRATAPLAPNMTTLAETAGKNPDEPVTLYRGVPDGYEGFGIRPGDFVTTNKQLAQDYSGGGQVVSMQARYGDVIDDRDEPLGDEYIYRPQAGDNPVEPHVSTGNEAARAAAGDPQTAIDYPVGQRVNDGSRNGSVIGHDAGTFVRVKWDDGTETLSRSRMLTKVDTPPQMQRPRPRVARRTRSTAPPEMSRDQNTLAMLQQPQTDAQREAVRQGVAASDADRTAAAKAAFPVGVKVKSGINTGEVVGHSNRGGVRVRWDNSDRETMMTADSLNVVSPDSTAPSVDPVWTEEDRYATEITNQARQTRNPKDIDLAKARLDTAIREHLDALDAADAKGDEASAQQHSTANKNLSDMYNEMTSLAEAVKAEQSAAPAAPAEPDRPRKGVSEAFTTAAGLRKAYAQTRGDILENHGYARDQRNVRLNPGLITLDIKMNDRWVPYTSGSQTEMADRVRLGGEFRLRTQGTPVVDPDATKPAAPSIPEVPPVDFRALIASGVEPTEVIESFEKLANAAWQGTGFTLSHKMTMPLLGTDGGFALRFDVFDRGGKRGEINRKFQIDYYGNLTVENSLFSLDKESQGKGLATRLAPALEDWYARSGVEQVKVHANIDVGGYTWGKQGFDWDVEETNVSEIENLIDRIENRTDFNPESEQIHNRIAALRARLTDQPDSWPTPYELAMLGYTDGAEDWPGKQGMLGADWMGVKDLNPGKKAAFERHKADVAKQASENVPAPDRGVDAKTKKAATEFTSVYANANTERLIAEFDKFEAAIKDEPNSQHLGFRQEVLEQLRVMIENRLRR